jgi:murein DD-endopeptidase MepM/ murein hydrolase activator NlpD
MKIEDGSWEPRLRSASLRAAGGSEADDKAARELREMSRHFEAMLTSQLLGQLSKGLSGSEEGRGAEGSLLEGFLWMEMMRQVASERDVGLADLIYRSLAPAPGPTRPGGSPTRAPATPGPLPVERAPAAPAPAGASPAAASVASPPPPVEDLVSLSKKLFRPVAGFLTSGFGRRRDPIDGQPRLHRGVDLAAPEGTAVRASEDGVVRRSLYESGYGNLVEIEHEGGLVTRYAHLRRSLTREGEAVSQGQVIGEVGQTGRATGPHLHFEVRRLGRPEDPEGLF